MAVEDEFSYIGNVMADFNSKIRELEDRQTIMRERLLLIGKNLIEIRDETNENLLEIKKELEILRQNMQRLTGFLEIASSEFSKFARKEDLQILVKQAKMFQPLDFVRKKDLKDLMQKSE